MSGGQLSHLDEVLGDLRYTLLALVNGEIRPVQQLFFNLHKRKDKGKGRKEANQKSIGDRRDERKKGTNLLESLSVIVTKLHSLPHLCR